MILIAGAGLIGKTIGSFSEKIGEKVIYKDTENHFRIADYEVMHVCFPYSKKFVSQVSTYINKFKPRLTIIHSTILPTTTSKIIKLTGSKVVFSPVIADHNIMSQGLKTFKKIIAHDNDIESAKLAEKHLRKIGFKTIIFDDLTGVEAGKPLLTSHFGVNIAFMQLVEQIYTKIGANVETYNEIQKIYNDGYNELRPNVRLPILFSGAIGGTCVMQNIKKLLTMFRSDLLRAVQKSNKRKIKNDKRNNNRT